MYGKEDYDIAVWASRIRLAQRYVPSLLAIIGIDALKLSKTVGGSFGELGGLLAGGSYPNLGPYHAGGPTFAAWEMFLAKSIYWILCSSFPVLRCRRHLRNMAVLPPPPLSQQSMAIP